MEEPPRRRLRASTFLIVGAVSAFLAGVVIVAVVLAGGDDDASDEPDNIAAPTAGSYGDQLLALGTALDDRLVELQTQLQADLAAEDDEAARLAIVKQNFSDNAAANDEFVSALDDVSPPEEVTQLHADMVAAGEAYVSALDEAIENLQDIETFAEAEAIILDAALEQQHSDFVDSCAAVVNFVEGQGTEIAIFC